MIGELKRTQIKQRHTRIGPKDKKHVQLQPNKTKTKQLN